ncbi:TRAP transporter permease [Salicibibacter cibarius]|uniref:TRAP transporter permease n=1 Tax=Salicibibacter cibarius TaxID=2743000 RepID=A0A7T7CD88_9BACI|nr:TRAP transporter permease [Salicibibacter cibarius]QQK77759.1 TRAP transporter permease [Salicibibacter cibarius]
MSQKLDQMVQEAEEQEIEVPGKKHRDLIGISAKVVSIIAIAMSLFHIYTALFGVFESIAQRSAHLAFALLLAFAIYRPLKRQEQHRIPWYDLAAMILIVIVYQHFVFNAVDIASRINYVVPLSTMELSFAIIAGLLLIEATRRVVGMAFTIIVIVFLLYGFFGDVLPGALGHSGFELTWIMDHLYYTTMGIFSEPLGVSSTFIILFILFGKFLEVSGAGQFFINLAVSVMGKYRGGPAKTAIAGSAVMGSISGSAVANTVTTGAFTIPLMKNTGVSPRYAGAVEAVSSSGGQIMPPIMGAGAFIIASYLGIPYIEVAIAAIVPALLYYICLYFQVDFRAKKDGHSGLEPSLIPPLGKVLKEGFHFAIPLLVIIGMLVAGYSPMRAGLFAIGSVIVVAAIKAATRLSVKTVFKALDSGARAALETALACASAGFIIGVIGLTDIGLQFSSMIIELAGGNLFITLIFTMIASIILGLGLPTVAAYIIQVPLTIPALIELGVEPISAHLFVFYFAILSAITPPVALAAFAASGLANSNPLQTGLTALRLGVAGFVVPFMFVYGPSLLLVGTPLEIAINVATAVIGVFALAAAAEGWWIRQTFWYERILLFITAILLVIPNFYVSLGGIALLVVAYLLQKMINKSGNHPLHEQA